MSKILLHIDLNQFFVACERIKDPSKNGIPLIVGGEGRAGIVSTCSYEARKYGIHSGMPTFQAKMLCKNVLICPGDYPFYELMSKEFISFVKRFSNKIEQLSIDECFVDITESFKLNGRNDINWYLKQIQDGLYKKTQLMCSIGVAPTKFLAKMGSDIKKPMGITIIRKKDIQKIIFPLHIKDYFGIGKQTFPKLELVGVHTIGDLYYAIKNNDERVLSIIGNFSEDIINQLEGNSSDELTLEHINPKSIGVSRTLSQDTNDKQELKDYLLVLAKGVINDMKSKGFMTKTITVQYKNADYNTKFKTKMFSHTFGELTDDKNVILNETARLFDNTYDGTVIRLIGFSVKNIVEKRDQVVQLTFDNFEENIKEDKIGQIINELNKKSKKAKYIRLSDLED